MDGVQTMLLSFASASADGECPGVLLEFPEQSVDPGEAVVIRAWAPDPALLDDIVLQAGLNSLGQGQPGQWPGQTVCAYFDYAGDVGPQQFAYPVDALVRVTAFSALQTVSDGVVKLLAGQGQDVTALFALRGFSCLAPAAALTGLHGTVHAVAARSPHCREWAWTAPAEPRGALWFFVFVDGALKRRFSLKLSEEPGDQSTAYTDVKIRVLDRRTGGAVPGADVWLDGAWVGRTNAEYGYVKVLRHLSGTYPLRVAKEGYPGSEVDGYDDNDAVTIPATGGEVRVLIGTEG